MCNKLQVTLFPIQFLKIIFKRKLPNPNTKPNLQITTYISEYIHKILTITFYFIDKYHSLRLQGPKLVLILVLNVELSLCLYVIKYSTKFLTRAAYRVSN